MKLDRTYTETQVRKLVAEAAKTFTQRQGSTGVTAWAKRHNVNKGHLSDFLASKRGPDNDVLNALGLEWKIVAVQRAQSGDKI